VILRATYEGFPRDRLIIGSDSWEKALACALSQEAEFKAPLVILELLAVEEEPA
jgi:hypothetical protein